MPSNEQSKTDVAKKQKIVEDKNFGLKNKNKSKNVHKYVQNLKQFVQPKPDAAKIATKKKEEEKAKEKELNELFNVAVSQPKVPVVFQGGAVHKVFQMQVLLSFECSAEG